MVRFFLSDREFTAFNGGAMFTFNPSVSFYVACESEAEIDRAWKKLLEGGKAMMQMRKIDIEKVRRAADDDSRTVVTVQTTVHAPVEKVWDLWTQPEHITHWNFASDDWHAPRAENDLQPGGQFNYRMEAKDGSAGFDFRSAYTAVNEHKNLEFTLDDGRRVQVHFSEVDGGTFVMENFEADNAQPVELQKKGWQAILDNFKNHMERS